MYLCRMINHNGEILDIDAVHFRADFRPIQYGDALFETVKFNGESFLLWEDHYFRLMASMRILRMEIPLDWSPEFLEEQMLETIRANHMERGAVRVRLTVYRDAPGKYTPKEKIHQGFIIQVEAWPHVEYVLNTEGLSVDVYKDHEVHESMLSNLKTTNSLLYTLAGIYADENDLDTALLINKDKHIVEAVSSNVYMITGDTLTTPPLSSGALKGVMRKHILRSASAWGLKVEEKGFSPFDLQRADEVWLSNAMHGIQWVGQYRKKKYSNQKALEIIAALNESVKQGV
ncbi:MAG: aminotransferase class IV [Bacteroidetes bacterium]|nr:MAG: aminotransferase class IV [Bacteroidota bacterium]